MAFHPVPNSAQVVMQYTQNGQLTENTYWVKGTGAWTDASLTDLINNVFGAWESGYAKNRRQVSTALTLVRATDYNSVASFGVEEGFTINGTRTAGALPNHCTFAVKALTGLSGRAKRGRTYWIGLAQDQLDSGNLDQTLTGAAANDIVAALNKLIDGTFTYPNGGSLVVAHRRAVLGGVLAWIDPAVTFPIIEFQAVDLFVDSQRRRLPGHNRHRR